MTAARDEMTVNGAFQHLVEWSEAAPLPIWQRDAMRRLYGDSPLSAVEEEKLLKLVKQLYGIEVAAADEPKAVPLSKDHVPTFDENASSLTISSIKNVQRVNALAANQSLHFNEQGVTVVFGNNGSGKSGYARILKNVCRARGSEDVLHNVYDTKPIEPPSAEIAFSIGGKPQSILAWKSGEKSSEALSRVSVFDSRCAPIHVEEKNEAAYTPLPLQILKELSDIARRFKADLQKMSTALEGQCPASITSPKCDPTTKAGAFIKALNSESDLAVAEELASLSDQELKHIENLKHQLRHDPSKAIAIEESKHRRLLDIQQRIAQLKSKLDDIAQSRYQALLDTAKAKSEAAQIAATTAFKDEPLRGVGSDTWNALWAAARDFSESEAFKDLPFPVTDNAQCVLCQQPFTESAVSRMDRFEVFVRENSQVSAQEAMRDVADARSQIKETIIEPSHYSQDMYFFEHDLQLPEFASAVRRFYRTCKVRRGRMMSAEPGDSLNSLKALDATVLNLCFTESEKIAERIEALKAGIDPEERSKIIRELQEFTDRQYLAQILDDVKAEVARRQIAKKIQVAISDTDTTRITRKSNELADVLVTNAWRDRFASEVGRLGIHHLRIELQRDAGAYGAARFKLSLVRDRSVPLGTVLSEGEYRCIALAAFFSELATSDSKSALVVDDPISSLDHDHREAVASRLAEEAAAGRQIIVFTHDVFFLDLLTRHVSRCNATVKFRTVTRIPDNSRSGVVENGIPPNVAPSSVLADGLKAQVDQFEQAYVNGRQVTWNEQTNGFSIQLRKCWERAVAEIVSPVLERFNVQVDTKNIWQLAAVENSDCVQMRMAYKRCSELNHEKCAELGRSSPTPADYRQEIDCLKTWVQTVRTRQATAQANHPVV